MPEKPSLPPVIELRVALTTRDYARLLKFYCAGLGIDPAQFWTDEHGQAAVLEMGRATLEIFDEGYAASVDQIEAGQRVSGPVRIAIQVPDLRSAVDRLLALGAILVHPPVLTPWGDTNARLRDPDGMQITLYQK